MLAAVVGLYPTSPRTSTTSLQNINHGGSFNYKNATIAGLASALCYHQVIRATSSTGLASDIKSKSLLLALSSPSEPNNSNQLSAAVLVGNIIICLRLRSLPLHPPRIIMVGSSRSVPTASPDESAPTRLHQDLPRLCRTIHRPQLYPLTQTHHPGHRLRRWHLLLLRRTPPQHIPRRRYRSHPIRDRRRQIPRPLRPGPI